jgi:hypothetical protein
VAAENIEEEGREETLVEQVISWNCFFVCFFNLAG